MEKYLQKVDSDYGFSIAKNLLEFKSTENGFRLAGTQAENDAANWIMKEMKRIGLQDVTKESFPADSWDFRKATVQILCPEGIQEPFDVCSFTFLKGTTSDGITGEVIYVGDGTKDKYEGLNVKDKIVLIDTDAYHTYWYNTIFSQAEERGAKAIIATVVGNGPGTYTDDIISVQDIMGVVGIPAVMLTKRDGNNLRELLKGNESVKVNLKVDIRLEQNAEAHYVYGIIPGRNPDRYILVGGHYDAYWDGFLDNATSLGAQLTIAKAMIESEYQPESTFVFVTNGAEECGIRDTYFDFATGSTAMIRQHPEWVTNTVIYNNFEMPAIDQTDNFKVTVSGCYQKVLSEVLNRFNLENGFEVFQTKLVGADDGIFNKAGAPTYMKICTYFGGEDPEAMENYDHTQYDNVDRYDADVFDHNNRIHGMINMAFDKMPMLPFDFTATTSAYWNDMDEEILLALYPDYLSLKELVKQVEVKSKDVYETAVQINALFEELTARNISRTALNDIYDKAWNADLILLRVNKMIQSSIYKFGPFSNMIIGHIQPYRYIIVLDKLIDELKTGVSGNALEILEELDNNYLIESFDKEVYEKVAIKAFDSSIPQSWGNGETLPFPDLYDVITAIKLKRKTGEPDFEKEIDTLKTIRGSQSDVFVKTLNLEKSALQEVCTLLDAIDMQEIISIEKGLINEK